MNMITFERLLYFIITAVFCQHPSRAKGNCIHIHVRENRSQVFCQLALHNLHMKRVFEDFLAKSMVSYSRESVRLYKCLSGKPKADQRTVC
jgi:hypothetical protein